MGNSQKTESLLLKSFFGNFISNELDRDDVSLEYITLLKLIRFRFDEIASKSKIARRRFVLELIEKYLTDENFRKTINLSELSKSSASLELQGSETPPIKLKQIELVNFRGFRANENDDCTGRKILFNGKNGLFFSPNGGGKSSLCEALEWTLTGDTLEHLHRNIESADTYFQNRDLSEPSYKKTKTTFYEDYDVKIPNPVFDRCFLEKNRIEKFARMATERGRDVQEILGELFGFTEIVSFCREFGQDLIPSSIEKNENENWQTWFDWEVKKKELERIIEESKAEEGKALKELNELLGNKQYKEKQKAIEEKAQELTKELESLEIDRSKCFSSDNFQASIKELFEKIKQWKECKEKISYNANNLDFERLYQAASSIFQDNPETNKCPLCDTPIRQDEDFLSGHECVVVTDPREKTRNELKKLETLTVLKEQKTSLETEIRNCYKNIKNEWLSILHNLKDENWISIAGNISKPETPNIDVDKIESYIYNNFDEFVKCCGEILGKDFSKTKVIEAMVLEYRQKRQELKTKKSEQENIISELKESLSKLEKASQHLSNKKAIKEKNEARLEELMKQSENSAFFKKLLAEYTKYYDSLHAFQSNVILAEAENIDDLVTGYYRALNFHDNYSEVVKSISFPKKTQEDFCFIYEKNKDNICNALQVLSEGHLRTLGLAALLARATKLNTLLLVFDDAINAIDSDHRDNIAHLIAGRFQDDQGESAFGDNWNQIKKYLSQCQLIITSHDRFFDEKLANLFERENQIRYVLYCDNNGIDFCEKGTPASFEEKIEDFLKPGTQDIRSAIFYCRIWLEELLLNIVMNFKKPRSLKPIDFTNIIDKKTRRLKNPELITIIDKLTPHLKKDDATEDQKIIGTILEKIKEGKETEYTWFFEVLNQESHYRRFDHVDISNSPTSIEVRKIFQNIQAINKIVNRR